MADERAMRFRLSAGGVISRSVGWVGLTVVLFLVAQLVALFVADLATTGGDFARR